MNFKKYSSIENAYQKRFIENIRISGYANALYHVQEKVHGANMGIYCDGQFVEFASRNHMLDDDESFYSLDNITEELAINTFNLWHIIKKDEMAEFVTGFVIYGELFGGGYPHPNVPKRNVSMVQKGVNYSPDVHFIAFDLYVTLDTPEDGEHGNMLRVSFANKLFDKVGFLRSPSLMMGTLDECLAYSNEFQTTIPTILQLPPLENNICEGVVIKPEIPCYLPNGSRVLIKNKNAIFAERTKAKHKEYKPAEPLSPEIQEWVDLSLEYINDNRYNNVTSKIGEIDYSDNSNIGRLIPALVSDAMEDFCKDNPEFTHLDKNAKKPIQRAVSNAAKDLILQKF